MAVACAACQKELKLDASGDLPESCPHCQHFARPTRLGRYALEERISRGGMGEVFRARHPELGTPVAIKILRTGVVGDTAAFAERFAREARLTARIPHPGVVQVFDFDCQDDRLYLVLEYIEGETLRSRLQGGPLSVDEALRIGAELCRVLAAAHTEGVLHRDVKPENIVLDRAGNVRVLDFGLSRPVEGGERLTRTGEILGTPEYMAPEQLLEAPDDVDARVDVYAAGVVLFEMLTGTSPFAGASVFQVLRNVEALDPPPPSSLREELPDALDSAVLAALSKDPSARPAGAAELAAELERWRAHQAGPVPPTPAAPARALHLVFAALFGLGAGFALAALRGGEDAGGPADLPGDPPAVAAAAALRDALSGPGGAAASALREAVASIPDSAAGAALLWRGVARRQLGEFAGSLEDLQRARDRGVDQARGEGVISWLCVHTLFDVLMDSAALLETRRPRAVPEWLPGADEDPEEGLVGGALRLARGDIVGAIAHLESIPPQGTARGDRRALLAMARLLAGEPDAAREVLDEAPDVVATSLPCRLLCARLSPESERADAWTECLRDVDRRAPERYRLELLVAYAQRDVARLRAAAELALLAGGGDPARVAFAGLRLDLAAGAAPGAALESWQAQALCRELQAVDATGEPPVLALRAALRIVSGERGDPLRDDLQALVESASPIPAVTEVLSVSARLGANPDDLLQREELAAIAAEVRALLDRQEAGGGER